MGHAVVHFEIGCKDSPKTQEFYRKMFDWKIEAMGPAAMIAPEPGGVGGHVTSLGHEPHHYTIFYVDVDDVAACRHSHGNVCVDAGSRRQHGGFVEGQEVKTKHGEFALTRARRFPLHPCRRRCTS